MQHTDGIVKFTTNLDIPCMMSTQSGEADTTTLQDAGWKNGEGFQFRHRFDSLASPINQLDHVANTDGIHQLAYPTVSSATTPGSRTMVIPVPQVLGGGVYAGEYNRYIVLMATYRYTVTSYEPFPIRVGLTVGVTAQNHNTILSWASSIADGHLKFGRNLGMATSRYMFENVDTSLDANGVVVSDEVNRTSDFLRQQPDTKSMLVPAAPIGSGSESIYGDNTTDHTTMRGVTRTLEVTVPVISLLNKVASGGVPQVGYKFSIDAHGGGVSALGVQTIAAVDPNVAVTRFFEQPGVSLKDETPAFFCNGGVFGTLWVVPEDMMRRMDAYNGDDTLASMQQFSAKVFVTVKAVHTVRLYDRKIVQPVQYVPDALVGLAAQQYAEVAETE